MNTLALLLLITPILLSLILLIPTAIANSRQKLLRKTVTGLAGLQFGIAAVVAVTMLITQLGVLSASAATLLGEEANAGLLGWTLILYDGVSAMMFMLVSFVGWVICNFSIRYLDGEANQGRYFKWTAFTVGGVSLMVLSGNLLLFMVAWVMTSVGLHRLLLHYPERPAAQRAAWTKFVISRIGDAALVTSFVLLYVEFKTLDLPTIFAVIGDITEGYSASLQLAGLMLILGAVTKSAQFPFHTWLPLTMETPTPVSALMHAGIVNAGGYLLIRTSPIVSINVAAMAGLAIIGAITACFAVTVMLTQTSVKKSLAYSTIAQMGFMMLQCGLGAFSSAMLHILAHSLYKAHAFLSSGSVIASKNATAGVQAPQGDLSWMKQALTGVIVAAFLMGAASFAGLKLTEKPGGVLLGAVLCLSLTQWIGMVMRTASHQLVIRAFAVAALLSVVYVVCFRFVDLMIGPSMASVQQPTSVWLVTAIVMLGFGVVFLLQNRVLADRRPAWIDSLHVHASSGFYVEHALRRVTWFVTRA